MDWNRCSTLAILWSKTLVKRKHMLQSMPAWIKLSKHVVASSMSIPQERKLFQAVSYKIGCDKTHSMYWMIKTRKNYTCIYCSTVNNWTCCAYRFLGPTTPHQAADLLMKIEWILAACLHQTSKSHARACNANKCVAIVSVTAIKKQSKCKSGKKKRKKNKGMQKKTNAIWTQNVVISEL